MKRATTVGSSRKRARRARLAALWIAFVLAASDAAAAEPAGPAHAAPSHQDKAQALELFERGSQAFAAKRFKDAIDLFGRADGLAQSPSFAYNIGVAYQEMGDKANALKWLREYLRRAPGAADASQVAQRVDLLARALGKKGVQQVTVLSEPQGATVLVDDRPVGVTPWTGELELGQHRVTLQRKDFQDASRDLTLTAERAEELRITIEPAPPPPPPAPPAAAKDTPEQPERPADEGGNGGVGPLTWVALGVGAAGLAGALGFELARSSAEDDARTEPVQTKAAEHAESMEDYQTAAAVLLGVGGAIAATGVVLLVVDLTSAGSDDPTASDMARHVRAGCHRAGCGLTVGTRF